MNGGTLIFIPQSSNAGLYEDEAVWFFIAASVVSIIHSILLGNSIDIGFSSMKDIVTSKFSFRSLYFSPAIDFEIAKRQVEAIGQLTASQNTKTLVLPSNISGIFSAFSALMETLPKEKK